MSNFVIDIKNELFNSEKLIRKENNLYFDDVGEVKPGTYAVGNIKVLDDGKWIELEKYAVKWWMEISNNLDMDVFISNDFLTQLSITFLLTRIRKEAQILDGARKTDYRLERSAENERILSKFIEIFKPEIEKKVDLFFKKNSFKGISREDILSYSYFFVKIAIQGESVSLTNQLLKEIINPQLKRQELRKLDRESRIHPIKTKKKEGEEQGLSRNNMDYETTINELLLGLLSYDGYKKEDLLLEFGITLGNFDQLVTMTINQNSERIFQPNKDYPITHFLFGGPGIGQKKGRKGRLWIYLRDLFKNYKKKEVALKNKDEAMVIEMPIHSKNLSKREIFKDEFEENMDLFKEAMSKDQYDACEAYANGKKLTDIERQRMHRGKQALKEYFRAKK